MEENFENFENIVIQNLIISESYFNKVFPVLNDYHFEDDSNLYIFKSLKKLFKEYSKKPSPKELALSIKEQLESSSEKKEYKDKILNHLKEIYYTKEKNEKEISQDYLNTNTTKFVKQAEMRQCIIDGAGCIKENKELSNIYDRLGKALEFSLDSNLGVSNNDTEIRNEFYNKSQNGLPFGIKEIDEALGGGIYEKTINVVCAVTHGGKSLLLGHFAINNILNGKNGVYLTLELPELMVWKRLDSNLLGIPINELKNYNITEEYKKRTEGLKLGTLFVKEYGAGVLDTLMLDSYIKKIQAQNNIKIDFICIDYLTLMKSYNYSSMNKESSYQYYKKICEELHRYAKESGIPILTASQLNRSAYGNVNAGMDSMSESMGISMTADTILILKRTEELDAVGHCLISFAKNRNTGNLGEVRVGIDFSTMSFKTL